MNERFVIISIILFIVILVSEYVAYASFHQAGIIKSAQLELFLMLIGVILPIIFIGSMIYGYKHYSAINSWLNTFSSIWLGIVFYIFLASLLAFIFIMLNNYLNLHLQIKLISNILVLVVLLLMAYGIINASSPKIINWEIKSEKLSKDWADKKIILISDIHLGFMRNDVFLRKIIKKIEKEKPDVVFIAGDLINGESFPYKKWLEEFSVLKPQFGILYVEGNHEKFSQEYDKFKSEIPDYIENLTDKKIIINNTQIIGLDYSENQTKEQIKTSLNTLSYEKEEPSIILMHDPKDTKYLAESGVSLALSGHTHGGQFFPFTIVVNDIYQKYVHGISYTSDTASVTSSGVGTSIIPIRIGTTPEIIVLNIK